MNTADKYTHVEKRYKPFDFVVPEDDPTSLIDCFYFYFTENYRACPAFFAGTLKQALTKAFNPESRRPLLIYIHHEESLFARLFCSEIFCNNDLINYLRENFIVWPWDITSKKSREKLEQWWRAVFPHSQLASRGVEEYPMLIGVIQQTPDKLVTSSPFGCQARALHRCHFLPQTGQRSTKETVLETLRTFKQECHPNQEFLIPFDFIPPTGLCPDVLLEIAKYLSLNDAVNAFSISILSLLHQAHTQVHLVNPSKQFLELIPDYLEQRQIASVRLHIDQQTSTRNFLPIRGVELWDSLPDPGKPFQNTINSLLHQLPNIRTLSLGFDGEHIDNFLESLGFLSSSSISCLQILYTGTSRFPLLSIAQEDPPVKNTTITSFLFDLRHDQWQSGNYSTGFGSPCFLSVALEFIQSLFNVRRVRFILNRVQIASSLQISHWEQLVRECVHLERVIIDVLGRGDFANAAKNIEQNLRRLRPGVIFRIKSI